MLDKEGNVKDVAETVEEWNHIADHRDVILQRRATEQASGDPWTLLSDRDELNEREVSKCLDAWCRDFLTYHLTPEQSKNPIYQLRGGLTSKQRSFCGGMLRKYAGHKAIGMGIWQKGLPCQLLARGSKNHWATQPRMIEKELIAMIQFFNSVGTTVKERRQEPAYAEAVRMSGGYRRSGLTPQDQRRKQDRLALKAQIKQGKALARKRDALASRSVPEDIRDSLSEEKQRILEDYDNKCFEEHEKASKRARLGAYRI